MNRLLALILLAGALALPALPVHADATDDLFEAAESGTASEVKAALASGADPTARVGKYGATPLHVAARINPDPDVTQLLLEAGVNIDARENRGLTTRTMRRGTTPTRTWRRCCSKRVRTPACETSAGIRLSPMPRGTPP